VSAEKKKTFFQSHLMGPGDQPDVAALWEALRQYAAQYSWVSMETDTETALVFQPEVVKPMRLVLKTDQPQKHRELHDAAFQYFDTMSRNELSDDRSQAQRRHAVTSWSRQRL
jgi:hypothetical protein